MIKTFSDGTTLDFGKGKIDNWCVYVHRKGKRPHAPRDVEYFENLHNYGKKYGMDRVYDDFVKIYDNTTDRVNQSVLNQIDMISEQYGKDSNDMAINLTIMYMGMIAEENKADTILGKRIKRYGFHLVMKDGICAEGATMCCHCPWRILDGECKKRGF